MNKVSKANKNIKRLEMLEARDKSLKKLWLSEIIEIEKPNFESNNLILAPVGSGKSSLIENNLIGNTTGRIIMLVSNETLKDHICPKDSNLRQSRANNGSYEMMYTTKNKKYYGNKNYNIHVMSYAEFGARIRSNNDFVKDVSKIFCDEIHSLPIYQSYNDSVFLDHAIKYLFNKHEGQQIFYFTATNESLLTLKKKRPKLMKDVKTFDYRNHPNIRKYVAESVYQINHIEQIRPHLKARLEAYNAKGYKALAFSRLISGQETIAKIAIEEGFKPLILWSIKNDTRKMSKHQLEMRNILIETGLIPDPYNMLIINSAMQEGWDLNDPAMRLAIMNTTNETEQIQALGRIRQDIDLLIYKTKTKGVLYNNIHVPEHYMGKPLTPKLKSELCQELNILDANGNQVGWKALKKGLIEAGYNIEESQQIIDGKRTRTSEITLDLQW